MLTLGCRSPHTHLCEVIVEVQMDHRNMVVRIDGQAEELFSLVLTSRNVQWAGAAKHCHSEDPQKHV